MAKNNRIHRKAIGGSLEVDDAFSPPYLNEEYPEVEEGLFQDRLSITSVCSTSVTLHIRFLVFVSFRVILTVSRFPETWKPGNPKT